MLPFVPLLALVLLLPPIVEPAAAQEPLRVHGRVLSADGGAATGMLARVWSGSNAGSAPVDAAGRFAVEIALDHDDAPVDLAIHSADPSADHYHAAVLRLEGAERVGEASILLVPRRWTVRTGTHAGSEVQLSPVRAFQPACPGCAAFYRRGSTLGSGISGGGVPGWPADIFPLRVAFDRGRSEQAITPADSARFWEIAGRAQQIIGRELFRPARFLDTRPRNDEGPNDVVMVWAVPSIREPGRGTAGFYHDRILTAALWIRDTGWLTRPEGRSLVMHELIHTLGFGHTCAWRSVMADNRICPRMRSAEPTAEDVAYLELAFSLNELAWASGARWGIEAAYSGERMAREPAARER
jgi:hypothetical protein